MPFGGAPRPVPGTIEAEDFDDGAEGVAYHDTTTGKVLFQTRLPAPLDGSAITYSVRGRQFIAVSTRAAARRPGGNAIYAFALPEAGN